MLKEIEPLNPKEKQTPGSSGKKNVSAKLKEIKQIKKTEKPRQRISHGIIETQSDLNEEETYMVEERQNDKKVSLATIKRQQRQVPSETNFRPDNSNFNSSNPMVHGTELLQNHKNYFDSA